MASQRRAFCLALLVSDWSAVSRGCERGSTAWPRVIACARLYSGKCANEIQTRECLHSRWSPETVPTYTYTCTSCNNHVEKRQSFTDPPLTTCEECGGTLRKIIHPVGIVFKGSGWYVTDSRSSSSSTNGPSTSTDSESSSKDSTAKESSSQGSSAKESGDAKESAPAKKSSSSKESSP